MNPDKNEEMLLWSAGPDASVRMRDLPHFGSTIFERENEEDKSDESPSRRSSFKKRQ